MKITSKNYRHALKQLGRELTFKSRAAGTYDPSTGTVSSDTETSYTVQGYKASFLQDQMEGTTTGAGSATVTFAPVDTSGTTLPTPNQNDLIDDKVVNRVQELYHASELVCYICYLDE